MASANQAWTGKPGVGAPVEQAGGGEFPLLARRLFGNVRLEFEDETPRESRLVSARLGACRLSRLSAGRHVVHGERVLSADMPEMIKLIIQTEGLSALHQSGRELPVGANTVVLYDPANPYVLVNPQAVDLLMLQLPRRAFNATELSRLKRPLVAAMQPGGLQRVLHSVMRSTMGEIEALDEAAREHLGQTMLDLVRGLMTAQPHAEARPHSLELLHARITDYVAMHLTRPELDAADIARRMGCSLRYVYRAFELEGMTPADYIWAERLRLAAQELRARPLKPGAIAEIAFGLGFSSSAHFSRAFRNRYHQSPRDWARMAGM